MRVLSRHAAHARGRLPAGVEVVEGDLRDRAAIQAALRGIDTVVSAATGFGPGGAGTAAVDERGNLELMSAAEATGARRFVLVSIHRAAAEHPMELNRRKFRAEEALRASGLDWRIVRPTVFAELWLDILGTPVIREKKATVFGDGKNPVNFVAIADVAAAVERAVFEDALSARVLEAGGPENMTLNDVVRLVASLAGVPARSRHVPTSVLRIASKALRPLRPDLSELIQAGITMASEDMTLDGGMGANGGIGATPLAEVAARLVEAQRSPRAQMRTLNR